MQTTVYFVRLYILYSPSSDLIPYLYKMYNNIKHRIRYTIFYFEKSYLRFSINITRLVNRWWCGAGEFSSFSPPNALSWYLACERWHLNLLILIRNSGWTVSLLFTLFDNSTYCEKCQHITLPMLFRFRGDGGTPEAGVRKQSRKIDL